MNILMLTLLVTKITITLGDQTKEINTSINQKQYECYSQLKVKIDIGFKRKEIIDKTRKERRDSI